MAVGTDCCDKLTRTTEASDYHEEYSRTVDARKRFVASKRWKVQADGSHQIKHKNIRVEIREYNGSFGILMNDIPGKKRFSTLFEAKIAVFDAIHSGAAQAFLGKRRDERRPTRVGYGRDLGADRIRAWLSAPPLI